MQTYPVDIDPAQIVHWIMDEQKTAPSTLRAVARRTTETREIPLRKELHLGDVEREDLSEVATTASLEIEPVHVSDGWRLTILVEDEAGPRGNEKGRRAIQAEEQIDLRTFYDEFIRSGRGTADVIASVEDSAASGRLGHLLKTIERNRHSPREDKLKP